MRKLILGVSALALVAGVAIAGEGGKIQWRDGKQLEQSLAEAKATGVPLVLYFTASW